MRSCFLEVAERSGTFALSFQFLFGFFAFLIFLLAMFGEVHPISRVDVAIHMLWKSSARSYIK
jgi:hypothetical protein